MQEVAHQQIYIRITYVLNNVKKCRNLHIQHMQLSGSQNVDIRAFADQFLGEF